MRRGLISRSLAELPDAVFDARLERVRAAMQAAKLDALVIYTNNTRPAGVSWLTGFVPYWSEALLVVPRERAPFLVAALSFRVKSWVERTSRIGEVFHTPRIGLKAAQAIAAMKGDARIGIVDFDTLALGIAEDLREGGPALAFEDAGALFAALRAKADAAEIALAKTAARIAHSALAAARTSPLGAHIAAVEQEARMLGAEEIYIAAAPDLARDCRFTRVEGEAVLGEHFALRATVAYKGTWIRLVRSFCDAALAEAAAARLGEAAAQLPSARGFGGFASWLVEGCRTTQPLDALMGSRLEAPNPPPAAALVSVQGALAIAGRAVSVGAPVLLGADGVAASLLIAPLWN